MTDVSYNQLLALDPAKAEMCGETCDADIMTDYGFLTTPDQVAAWMRAHDGTISNGTPFSWHANYFSARSIANQFIGWADIPTATARGNIVMVLIKDDSNANPSSTGSFLHFIVITKVDATVDETRNPWGGRYVNYPISQVAGAFQGALEVFRPAVQLTTTQPTTSSTMTEKEGDMASIRYFTDGSNAYRVFTKSNGCAYAQKMLMPSGTWQTQNNGYPWAANLRPFADIEIEPTGKWGCRIATQDVNGTPVEMVNPWMAGWKSSVEP